MSLRHNILNDDILTYNIIFGDFLQEERNKVDLDNYKEILITASSNMDLLQQFHDINSYAFLGKCLLKNENR